MFSREFSLDSQQSINTKDFRNHLERPSNRRVYAFRLSKVRQHQLFREPSLRLGLHFFPRIFESWKKKRFGLRGPGAKTVMCRLNVNGDSHLFQPLGPWLSACVCVTNYTQVRVYARLTREESARVLYECHGE